MESESDVSSTDEGGRHDIQDLILQQLQKMNSRLQVVEEQMECKQGRKKKQRSKGQKLSTVVKTCKKSCKKDCCVNSFSESSVNSDSSDDETSLRDLSLIRTSRVIQKQIDISIAKLSKQQIEGNDQAGKLKSKRGEGGAVDVVVQQKVTWPHEQFLGGHNR